MSTSYQKEKKKKTPVEIISHNYGTCQQVCVHMRACLREAGSTSQKRAGLLMFFGTW